MRIGTGVERETKSPARSAPAEKPAAPQSDQSVDEFFNRLQSEMRRPDLSQDAITAAFHAIQKLALESDTEEAVAAEAASGPAALPACPSCHAPIREPGPFCAACGASLTALPAEPAASTPRLPMPAGEHHYHHHYHHHYFAVSGSGAQPGAGDFRPAASLAASRDAGKARNPLGGTALSRAESAVRKMTQDWALACNTKHLDDLVELYAADALVLRPNVPPIRGTAAIREFLFAALDAGLGEAELDPLRVELFGDVAFEAGRCKTLVPVVVGKRREERGKYLVVLIRQPAGDWKIIVDSWSSDLSLGTAPEAAVSSSAQPAGVMRAPRK
jgi:ketosteroid isomerase-like protein